jgi:hypothetical protein
MEGRRNSRRASRTRGPPSAPPEFIVDDRSESCDRVIIIHRSLRDGRRRPQAQERDGNDNHCDTSHAKRFQANTTLYVPRFDRH